MDTRKTSLLKLSIAPWLYLLLAVLIASCSTKPFSPSLSEGTDPDQVIRTQSLRLANDGEDSEAHYHLAVAFLKKQKFVEAEQHVKRATQLSPLNGLFFELLGDIAFRTERFGIAINAYNSALRLQPDLISAYLKLALVHEQLEDYDRAIAALEESLTRERLYLEAFFNLARLHLMRSEYEDATEAINSALRLEPKNKELLMLQIRIQAAQGHFFHARTLIEQFLQDYPDSREAHHQQLKILFVRQQWDEALRYLTQMDQNENLYEENQVIRAQIFINLNRLDDAQNLLWGLLEKSPTHVELMNMLALIYLQKGDLKQAQQWLDHRIEIDGGDAQTHYMIASIFFKQRNFLQGDLSLNRVLGLAPLNQKYQLLALRRRLLKGEFQAVENQLGTFLEKDALNPEVLRLKADLFTLRGEYGKAEKLLRQMRLIQESDILDFSLARVLYFEKKYQEVLPLVRKLAFSHPNEWENTYLYAATLFQLGRFWESFQQLEPLLEKGEGDGFIHRLVGEYHVYQKNDKKALAVYQQGLEKFPRQVYLIEGLSSIYLKQELWQEAHDLILLGLEQNHVLKPVLLNRLIQVTEHLDLPEKLRQYQQDYYRQIDPILNSQTVSSEKRILFPVASPILAFSEMGPLFDVNP